MRDREGRGQDWTSLFHPPTTSMGIRDPAKETVSKVYFLCCMLIQEFCIRTSVDVKLSNELNFKPVSKQQSILDQKD